MMNDYNSQAEQTTVNPTPNKCEVTYFTTSFLWSNNGSLPHLCRQKIGVKREASAYREEVLRSFQAFPFSFSDSNKTPSQMEVALL